MLKPKPILFYGCRGTSQLNTPINNTLKHTINSHLGSIQFKRTVCRITAILMLISSTFGAVASTNKGDKPGDAPTRIMNSMLSKQATIVFPGYDVDSQTSPVSDCDGDGIPDQLRPEVNKV